MIPRNPASYAQRPKKPVTEMEILNESQISQRLVASNSHRLEELIHLALVTGAQQMELLGLSWDHIDWVKKTRTVQRQLNRPDSDEVKFSPPKTRLGRRVISLGTMTIDILRRHYECQEEERLTAGDHWVECGLIFTTSNGTPIHPRNLLRDFKILLANAGLRIVSFHSLRHNSASLLLSQGIL
jgi:integrase